MAASWDFSSLFNSEHCCDLIIHTSNNPSTAILKCHKILIRCASDKLYDALMNNKIEASGADLGKDHVLIIPELQNKDEALAKLFINAIYDGSIILKHDNTAQLDELKEIFSKYGMVGIKNAIASKFKATLNTIAIGLGKIKPKLNGSTDLSDFTIYLDKDKKNYFKTHQIILEKGNCPIISFRTDLLLASEYYAGLFGSGMQESNSRESILSADFNMSIEDFGNMMQTLLGFVYSNSDIKREEFENMTPDTLFGISAIAGKYFFNGIKKQFDAYIESTKEYPEYIIPAIKYNDTTALTFATDSLIRNIFDVNLEMIPADFLMELRVGNGGTIFQAILSALHNRGALTRLHQIQVLEKMFGENAPTSLRTKDEGGNNCLHTACKSSSTANSEAIELMIARNFDVNERNNDGDLPLKLALAQMYEKAYYETFFNIPEPDRFPKEATLSIIDKLILAGARVDLEKDEDLEALVGHACRCEDKNSDECWKIITDELDKVDKQRIQRCLKRASLDVMLANVFKKPIDYFLGKLGLSFKHTAISRNRADKKLVTIKSTGLQKLTFDGDEYDIKDIKVTSIYKLLEDHNNHPWFDGFEITLGYRSLYFQATNNYSVYTFVAGLVYLVAGSKNLQSQNKSDKKKR